MKLATVHLVNTISRIKSSTELKNISNIYVIFNQEKKNILNNFIDFFSFSCFWLNNREYLIICMLRFIFAIIPFHLL